jgi:hypothetical protein
MEKITGEKQDILDVDAEEDRAAIEELQRESDTDFSTKEVPSKEDNEGVYEAPQEYEEVTA